MAVSEGVRAFDVRNIVNVTMTTNDRLPVRLGRDARRFYPLWTDITIRGPDGEVTEEWKKYWAWYWPWMRDHWEECVYYLMNEVDLSDFDPGQAPPVTDFMREIQEASEDQAIVMLRDLIQEGNGFFEMDLLTAEDIHDGVAVKGELFLDKYGLVFYELPITALAYLTYRRSKNGNVERKAEPVLSGDGRDSMEV